MKETGAAHRDVATHMPKATLNAVKISIDLISLLVVVILFTLHLVFIGHENEMLILDSCSSRSSSTTRRP